MATISLVLPQSLSEVPAAKLPARESGISLSATAVMALRFVIAIEQDRDPVGISPLQINLEGVRTD